MFSKILLAKALRDAAKAAAVAFAGAIGLEAIAPGLAQSLIDLIKF